MMTKPTRKTEALTKAADKMIYKIEHVTIINNTHYRKLREQFSALIRECQEVRLSGRDADAMSAIIDNLNETWKINMPY